MEAKQIEVKGTHLRLYSIELKISCHTKDRVKTIMLINSGCDNKMPNGLILLDSRKTSKHF